MMYPRNVGGGIDFHNHKVRIEGQIGDEKEGRIDRVGAATVEDCRRPTVLVGFDDGVNGNGAGYRGGCEREYPRLGLFFLDLRFDYTIKRSERENAKGDKN
jgi:hypothetical protein